MQSLLLRDQNGTDHLETNVVIVVKFAFTSLSHLFIECSNVQGTMLDALQDLAYDPKIMYRGRVNPLFFVHFNTPIGSKHIQSDGLLHEQSLR